MKSGMRYRLNNSHSQKKISRLIFWEAKIHTTKKINQKINQDFQDNHIKTVYIRKNIPSRNLPALSRK